MADVNSLCSNNNNNNTFSFEYLEGTNKSTFNIKKTDELNGTKNTKKKTMKIKTKSTKQNTITHTLYLRRTFLFFP